MPYCLVKRNKQQGAHRNIKLLENRRVSAEETKGHVGSLNIKGI